MRTVLSAVVFTIFLSYSWALDNGVGRTPPMGWNPYNKYCCGYGADLIQQSAQAMQANGLQKAGYVYVNLDDGWQSESRDSSGALVGDPKRFPDGMGGLGNFLHSLGFKFGIYSDAGNFTCGHHPGSLGHELQDAKTFASWGVDYLKYDNCYSNGEASYPRYTAMRDALNASGRPIFFNMCEWGYDLPALWGSEVANSWRTFFDMNDNWSAVMFMIKWAALFWNYSGPGAWNDPDMMELGNGVLTTDESYSHMALWSLSKAPLILGCDVIDIDAETLSIATNPEVIAVNQDPLGKQGQWIRNDNNNPATITSIWAGRLSTGAMAVILLNEGNSTTMNITLRWSDIQLPNTTKAVVRDLWVRKDIGVFSSSFTATDIRPHASRMLTLRPYS